MIPKLTSNRCFEIRLHLEINPLFGPKTQINPKIIPVIEAIEPDIDTSAKIANR